MPIFKFQSAKPSTRLQVEGFKAQKHPTIKNMFIFGIVSKKGFTLIELLVVVAIIAVLSFIGVASFNNYSSSEGVKNAAFYLQSDLRKYQNFMISGQENLKPDITNACYQNDYRVTYMVYKIFKANGATPSKLLIYAVYTSTLTGQRCGLSPCALSGTCFLVGPHAGGGQVWPDKKVGQVIDVGYVLKSGVNVPANSVAIYSRSMDGIYTLNYYGAVSSGPIPSNADRLYIDLGRGTTTYYRVYVTYSGAINVQKI
jgi:prepilin-type N-terminal cleavage/methylation domain-containing protein